MRNRGRTAGRRGEVSSELELAASIEALDQATPGWDDGLRALGIVRRLEKDASASGFQTAVHVYGEEAVLQVLPCAGLFVVNGEVFGADGKARYTTRDRAGRARRAQVSKLFGFRGEELSEPEIELIHDLLKSGKPLHQLARELNVSEARLQSVRDSLLRMSGLGKPLRMPPWPSALWNPFRRSLEDSEKTGSL